MRVSTSIPRQPIRSPSETNPGGSYQCDRPQHLQSRASRPLGGGRAAGVDPPVCARWDSAGSRERSASGRSVGRTRRRSWAPASLNRSVLRAPSASSAGTAGRPSSTRRNGCAGHARPSLSGRSRRLHPGSAGDRANAISISISDHVRHLAVSQRRGRLSTTPALPPDLFRDGRHRRLGEGAVHRRELCSSQQGGRRSRMVIFWPFRPRPSRWKRPQNAADQFLSLHEIIQGV